MADFGHLLRGVTLKSQAAFAGRRSVILDGLRAKGSETGDGAHTSGAKTRRLLNRADICYEL